MAVEWSQRLRSALRRVPGLSALKKALLVVLRRLDLGLWLAFRVTLLPPPAPRARDYSNFDQALTRYYSEYLFDNCRREQQQALVEKFKSLLSAWVSRPEVRLALDVGAGEGEGLEAFRQLGVQAVGVVPNAHDQKILAGRGYDARVADMSFLPFDDAAFDLVLASHVLEHSPFSLMALYELNRVLKKGARLLVLVPFDNYVKPEHVSVLRDINWKTLFARTGFQLLKRVVVNSYGEQAVLFDDVDANFSGEPGDTRVEFRYLLRKQ